MKTDNRKYVEYASEEWRQRARHYWDVNGQSQWREQGAYDVSTTLPHVRAVGTERRSNVVPDETVRRSMFKTAVSRAG